MPSVYNVNDSLRPSLVISWIFGYVIWSPNYILAGKKHIVSHLPINDQLHEDLGYYAILIASYKT